MKILLQHAVQRGRVEQLLFGSRKYLAKRKIALSYNKAEMSDEVDVILILINSRVGWMDLPEKDRKYYEKTKTPIIILERLDSAVSWFREFDRIHNLAAVYKNRVPRNKSLYKAPLFQGRYHYGLIKPTYISEKGNKKFPPATGDRSNSIEKKGLPSISDGNIKKIKTVLWDFHSSPYGKPCKYFREKTWDIHRERSTDVFCINHDTDSMQGWYKRRAKNIIRGISGISSVTEKVLKEKYDEEFAKSKICVACWGYGEWVHMDAYAMYAGVLLIKPDTGHVMMDPDLYQNNVTYVPCKPDLSDLESKIRHVLTHWDEYVPMLERAQKLIREHSEQHYIQKFWETVQKDAKSINVKK